MTTKATAAKLGSLHGTVAETLAAEIRGYKDRGEPVPAALLAQAIKFLSENGISADPEDTPGLQDLRSKATAATAFPFDPSKTN